MCNDCFNGCDDKLTSDRCVKYTGADITSLDICEGDSLKEVEGKITDRLIGLSDGSAITLNPTLGCLSTAVGTDKTLPNILQQLITAYCSSKSAITTLQGQVNPSYAFDKKCLTFSSSASRDVILQAVITKLCTINTSVTTVSDDYVKATELDSLISTYLTSTSSSITQQSAKMVPYVAYEYYGPMSNFDATGKGLSAAGFDKVYICNGSYNTPDRRGRTAVGATVGVPGGSFDSTVDPGLPANTGYANGLKDKFGSINTTLSTTQIPAHSHSVTDPGHSHGMYYAGDAKEGGEGNHVRTTPTAYPINTAVKETGITIGSTGGSEPHSNVQPSIAANFIMYIPS